MVAYSFKHRFVAPIRSGEKRQTIRAISKKIHAQPEEKLQLYCGQRTRYSFKIADAVCTDVQRVEISPGLNLMIKIENDRWLSPQETEDFAKADGFASAAAMQGFWLTNNGPGVFHGIIIRWGDITLP